MTTVQLAPFHAVGPHVPVPATTVGDLVLDRARRTPDAIAVRQWDLTLTYRELLIRASALAERLRAVGVGPDHRVGVCVSRSPDLVTAALGVLLSGGAYVPLDPEGPRQRLRDIAEDAAMDVVVCDAGADATTDPVLRALGARHTVPVPGADAVLDETALATVAGCPAGQDDLANVLFTSGSTGRPKGVLVTHRGFTDFVVTWGAITDAGADTRALGFCSLGFDPAAIDLFTPLAVGGTVMLARETDRDDPTRLQRFLVEHRVNWGFITPTVLDLLDPDALPEWTSVQIGGEAVPGELVHRWTRPDGPARRIHNAYGPTEATVVAVTTELDRSVSLTAPTPIGRAVPNHHLLVLDDELRPLPPGHEGELVVGGPGVARGYLNRPELTEQRFIADPLDPASPHRLYRTGDVVRADADGVLVYLGRRDGQVKVRGQRVEIGEVEAVLREHPGIEQIAVVAVRGASGLDLVAVVTPADGPDRDALVAHAGERLTSAMLPSRVLHLDVLPRNASDKVDRGLLTELAGHRAEHDDEPTPVGGPVARAVASAWRTVLGATPRPDDDFLRAGGSSIAAMRLVARLRDELDRDVTVAEVFDGRTAAGIADRVAATAPLDGPRLRTGADAVLSAGQRRLWFLDQLDPESAPYNIAFAERLRGPLDVPALHAALSAVVARHDVLRWRIRTVDGAPVVSADGASTPDLPVVDLRTVELTEQPDTLREHLDTAARTPIDLGVSPWRVVLYRLGPTEHVLGVVMHHAVFDGWSQSLFHRDLGVEYAAARHGAPDTARRAPLSARYADYATWRAEFDARHSDTDVAWWVTHLGGAPHVLDLPRDHPRPAVQTHRGAQCSAVTDNDGDAAVRALADRCDTTPAAVLLAGLGGLLNRLTGGTDHVLATVVADRKLAACQDTIGFFVDTAPLRLRTDPESTFAAQVVESGLELRRAAAHTAAPVERIVEALGVRRDPSRTPLVQVLFNVLDFTEPTLTLPGLSTEPVAVSKPGSPFDLTVYVTERGGRLGVELLFNPDLFSPARMAALADDYLALTVAQAHAAVREPDTEQWAVADRLPRAALRLSGPQANRVSPPPAPAPPAIADDPAAAATIAATEAVLTRIWCEVLGLTTVRPTDNFFDVGGHSLALTTVHAKVVAALGRPVPVVDLFRHPNIRALAAHLYRPAENPELARAAERAAARRGRARRRRPDRSSGAEHGHGGLS